MVGGCRWVWGQLSVTLSPKALVTGSWFFGRKLVVVFFWCSDGIGVEGPNPLVGVLGFRDLGFRGLGCWVLGV